MTVHAISFRITTDEQGLAGPKAFRPNLTLIEADRLRERLFRLEQAGLVTEIDIELERFGGEDEPIHQLLDIIDPVTIAAAAKHGA